MTTTTAAIPTSPAPDSVGGGRRLLAVLALAVGVTGAWFGGLAGLGGAALAVLAGAGLFGSRVPATAVAQPVAPGPTGRHGAEVMVAQVVPVWSRQMEVTREAANDGLAQLLQSFGEIAGTLGQLTGKLDGFSVTARPGAADEAIRLEQPALERLCATSERAFAQRDAAVATLTGTRDGLAQLRQLAKQAREVARHTRLVAFNASIEANRQRSAIEGGSQAVASELRTLAGRMATIGEGLEHQVVALSAVVDKACRRGMAEETGPDELRMEVQLRAREALHAMLGALGASLQGSSDVHAAGQALRDQIDSAFVHFQFGDRVSQMMSIVANDMSNFARWVSANPLATQSDAAEWLATLEASYTMEEQRSHHHGNVHVERDTGVEFF